MGCAPRVILLVFAAFASPLFAASLSAAVAPDGMAASDMAARIADRAKAAVYGMMIGAAAWGASGRRPQPAAALARAPR